MLEKRIEISEGKIKEIEEERRRLIEGMTSVSETNQFPKLFTFQIMMFMIIWQN